MARLLDGKREHQIVSLPHALTKRSACDAHLYHETGGSRHLYLKIRRAGPEPAPHPLSSYDIMETTE